MGSDKIARKERRRRDAVVKAANRYHDELMLAFLRVIQKENNTNSPKINSAFKLGDAKWRAYCKGKLTNNFTLFSDNALKQIKGIESYAKKLIPNESQESQAGSDQGGELTDQESKQGEESGEAVPTSNS